MFNKKVLIEALKKVNAAKAPAKTKDVDYNSKMGYRDDSPFRKKKSMKINTPDGTIDMSNTGIPLIANDKVLAPYSGVHQFDTNEVIETPLVEAKKGGIKSKKYSKSLLATNKLYKKNPLYKKKNYKSKTYDPMAMYFQPGGSKTTYYNYGEPWYYNKNKYKKVGNQWYISNEVTDFKWQPIKDPTGNRAKELNKNATVDPQPWMQNPNTIEGKINAAMGDPQSQAARASAYYAPPNEDDLDNLRHAEGARRTQEAIAKATGSDLLGYFGAIGLGVGHELGTMFSDPRPWEVVTQEGYEDAIKNNIRGAEMGYFHTPNATKRLNYLAQTYQMPDGYGEVKPFPGSNWTDPYDQIQRQKAQQEVWNNPNPKPVSLTEKFADGGPTKPGCRPVPPTASEIQSQVLSEGKGPTAEGAARVKRASEARAAWEKRCGVKPVTEVKPEIKFEEKPKRKLGQLGPQSFKNGGDISIPDLNQYKKGGYIEMKLTPEEIKKYVADGHVVEDISNYKKGGALLTKKVTCKKCGWEWDAADGGNDMTTCHKCGGEGLIHAQPGMIVRNAEGIGRALKGTSEFRNMMNTLNEAGEILPSGLPASVNLSKTSLPKVDIPIPKVEIPKISFSPTRVAASRPIPPSGFSPIRMGDDYLHKGSEWYHIDPADYASTEDWKKLGLQDASDSLNSFLSKLPPYGPNTFKGIGDFNFKDFSQGSNFRRDMLAAAAGPQRQLSTEDFFTDDELVRMANQQADYWNARDQFDVDNPEDPANMALGFFTGDRSRDELFSLLYPNASMPNFRSKFMTPRQEKLTTDIIGPFTPSIDKKGMLSKGSLNTSVNSYSKDIPSEAAKLSSFQKGDDWLMTAPAEIVVGEMRQGLGLNMEDVKNATPEQLEKWRQQIVSRMQKQTQERYKALLGNPFTAGDAYSKMTLNKYGGSPIKKK